MPKVLSSILSTRSLWTSRSKAKSANCTLGKTNQISGRGLPRRNDYLVSRLIEPSDLLKVTFAGVQTDTSTQYASFQRMERNSGIKKSAPGNTTQNASEFRRSIESLIINNKRPQIYRNLESIITEVVKRNTQNQFLNEVLVEGQLNIDILDAIQENAFVERSNNNIYITTALLQKIQQVFPNKYYDAVAFILCHEIGHKIASVRRGELKDNIGEKDNTHEEDFADKTALELMHKAGFDIESIKGIFGKLFGERKGTKSIPGIDSHPHGADRDLFIEQQVTNEIYSKQKGEYVSVLSKKTLQNLLLEELVQPNKYDFAKGDAWEEVYPSMNENNIRTIEQWITWTELNKHNSTESTLNPKAVDILQNLPLSSDSKVFYAELINRTNGHPDTKIQCPRDLSVIKKIISELPNFHEYSLNDSVANSYAHSRIVIYLKIIGEISSNKLTVEAFDNVFNCIKALDAKYPNNLKKLKDESDTSYFFSFEQNIELVRKFENLILNHNLEIEVANYLNYLTQDCLSYLCSESSSIKNFYFNNIDPKFIGKASHLSKLVSLAELVECIKGTCDGGKFETLFLVLGQRFEHNPGGGEIDWRQTTNENDYEIFSRSIKVLEEAIDRLINPLIDPADNLMYKKILVGYLMDSLAFSSVPVSIEDFQRSVDISLLGTEFHLTGNNVGNANNIFKPFLEGQNIHYINNNESVLHSLKFYNSLREVLQNPLRVSKKLLQERFDKEFLQNPVKMPPTKDHPIESVIQGDSILFRFSTKPGWREKKAGNSLTYESYKLDHKGNKWPQNDDWFQHKFIEPKEFKTYFDDLFIAYPALNNKDVFKAFLSIQNGQYQVVLLENFARKHNREFDLNFINEFAPFLENSLGIRFTNDVNNENWEYTHTNSVDILEASGFKLPKQLGYDLPAHDLSPHEYLYFKYFQANLENFRQRPAAEVLTWIEKNWKAKGSFRDVILNKIFNNVQFNILDRGIQLQAIKLFDSEFKSIKLREKYLNSNLPKVHTLAEKMQIIVDALPDASKERNLRIENAFLETGFSFEDVQRYKPLFLENSLEAFRKERIATHGAGAVISYILNAENDNLADTRKTVTWLTGQQSKLPGDLQRFFVGYALKPDQLRELFKEAKSLREGAIQEIFTGNKGFFNNKKELHLLLNDLFGKSLAPEQGRSKQIQDRNKLKAIVQEALYKVFDSENEVKKLEIINRMIDKIIENPNLEFEDLVQVLLSSYGTVGVKLAQILASQNEIKVRFPTLHQKLSDLKDANVPIPISELMKAIDTSPVLKNKNVKILKLIGSASMKCVYLAEIDGEQVVLKVRRIRADKGLNGEIEDFEYLLNQLSPLLKQQFGISNIPNYSERIFNDIREEANLEIESINEKEFAHVIEQYNSLNQDSIVEFAAPTPNDQLSNGVVMVETIAEGRPLKVLREELEILKLKPNKTTLENQKFVECQNDIRTLERELARFFSFSADKFIHVDPHDGNIFVYKTNEGKFKVTFIDLGLAQEMTKMTPKIKGLMQDRTFLETINSISNSDLKLLSEIVNFVDIKSLMSGNSISWNIFRNFLSTPLKQKWLTVYKTDINPMVVLPALNKLAMLRNILREHGLTEEFNQLIDLLGTSTIRDVLKKSQGKNLKETSLILLNVLDNSQTFTVDQKLWRFLLSLSKAPYVIEKIRDNPQILSES